MDESLVCECGNTRMWYFWEFSRCTECFNEYKLVKHINPINQSEVKTYLMRRFNNIEKRYNKNWEKSQKTYKNKL